jgi:hypothetical protein
MRQYLEAKYKVLENCAVHLLGSRDEALDVVHDAVGRLLLHCDRVEARRVAEYCFTTLRNVIYDHWRAKQRRRGGRPGTAGLVGRFRSPPLEAEGLLERALHCVRVAFQGLRTEERTALSAWWKMGARQGALKLLGLEAADKNEQGRVYDQPLYKARKALRSALKPLRDARDEIPADVFWQSVLNLVGPDSPDAPLK